MTIADLSAYEEFASAKLLKWDLKDKPKIQAWINKVEAQPFYKEIHEVLFKVLAKL